MAIPLTGKKISELPEAPAGGLSAAAEYAAEDDNTTYKVTQSAAPSGTPFRVNLLNTTSQSFAIPSTKNGGIVPLREGDGAGENLDWAGQSRLDYTIDRTVVPNIVNMQFNPNGLNVTFDWVA